MHNAKSRAAMLLLALLLALVSPSPWASASYSSIYAFGDGVCTTTGTPSPANYYHGGRYCNGRVWIEVLSEWHGVSYSAENNVSYYGQYSTALKTNVGNLTPPADASTALFIVWCADADFVKFASDGTPWQSGSLGVWNSKIAQSIADHSDAIATLYSKGARTIVMPTAVNIASIPLYNNKSQSEKSFFRDRVIDFNTQFKAATAAIVASPQYPGLKIHHPDVFTFFENVLANPGNYGLVNPYPSNAAISLSDRSFAGPGSVYVFWDYWHPTAKFQMLMADYVQQFIWPVKVNSLTVNGGNVQLQVANIPLARAGAVEGCADMQSGWQQEVAVFEPFVAGGNTTKTITFPSSGSKRFYRVGFPVLWAWP